MPAGKTEAEKVSCLEYQCMVTSLKPRWGFRVVQDFRAFGICSLLLPYWLRASLSMQGGPGSKGPRGDRGDRGVSVSNTVCHFLLNLYSTNWDNVYPVKPADLIKDVELSKIHIFWQGQFVSSLAHGKKLPRNGGGKKKSSFVCFASYTFQKVSAENVYLSKT